jgi:hypothetical protein
MARSCSLLVTAQSVPLCLVVEQQCIPLFTPVQRPFQIVGVDIMDLPLTKRGNQHVLVFQDHFSKWPIYIRNPWPESTVYSTNLM